MFRSTTQSLSSTMTRRSVSSESTASLAKEPRCQGLAHAGNESSEGPSSTLTPSAFARRSSAELLRAPDASRWMGSAVPTLRRLRTRRVMSHT